LLSSILLIAISSARSKARDTQRRVDLYTMQKALDLYYQDNGQYPVTSPAGSWWGISQNGGSKTADSSNPYIPGLIPNYINRLPVDPKGDVSGWTGYLYRSDGVGYKLLSHQNGPESFPLAGQPFYDPQRPVTAWMLCVGATECGW
jgi:type II secretory pathway pseudopilin PulG